MYRIAQNAGGVKLWRISLSSEENIGEFSDSYRHNWRKESFHKRRASLYTHKRVRNIFLSSRVLIDAEKMPVHVFTVESKVRGYHVYKGIWNPSMDGRQLPCEREIGNSQDPCAVAVMENLMAGIPSWPCALFNLNCLFYLYL